LDLHDEDEGLAAPIADDHVGAILGRHGLREVRAGELPRPDDSSPDQACSLQQLERERGLPQGLNERSGYRQ